MSGGLKQALGLGPKEMVALVGGGGKTTLMFSLARELISSGKKVITGPSTKILTPSKRDTPLLMLQDEGKHFLETVLHELARLGHVTVGQRLIASSKVDGFEDDFFTRAFGQESVDYVVVEADGANGRPLKAPRDHEPVIPVGVTVVVGIVGLDSLGKILDEKTVFAPQRLCKVTGAQPGDIITKHTLFLLARHPQGLFKHTPDEASRVIFLNKIDRLDPSFHIQRVLAELSKLDFPVRLVWGSLLPEVELEARTFS